MGREDVVLADDLDFEFYFRKMPLKESDENVEGGFAWR